MVLDKDKIDGIIFDLDGTLWDTTERICEAWNLILNKHEEIDRETITHEDLTGCMGLPMYDIAARLFPKEKTLVRNSLMDELCVFENGYLAEKGGILYDGLEETLSMLAKKYPLFIVSNCQDGYIEAFLKAHKMVSYFKDTECWGRTRMPKGESNKILINRNGLKNPVYVGDTAGDAQSAIDAGIPFIYAGYGFGSVKDYAAKLDSIRDLIPLLGDF
ncbi:MAG: HAD family hydrolase [Eubacteriales bacterium]|nr:HAD family hydrolase [Eubacteriales bacterium]